MRRWKPKVEQTKRGRRFNPETQRIGVSIGFPSKVEKALRRHCRMNGNNISAYVTSLVVKDLGISIEVAA